MLPDDTRIVIRSRNHHDVPETTLNFRIKQFMLTDFLKSDHLEAKTFGFDSLNLQIDQ